MVGFSNQSDWKKDETESFLKETATAVWQKSKITGFTRRANGTIDWSYQLSGKDELGGNLNFSYSKLDWTDKGRLKQTDADKEDILNVQHNNDLGRDRTDAGINLFYQHRFNQQGQVLNIDFDYIYSRNKQFVWNRMDNLDDNLQYLSPYNYYQEIVPQSSNIWSSKMEYRQNVGNNQLIAGLDSYYSKIDNKDTFMQGTDDGYVEDKNKAVTLHWKNGLLPCLPVGKENGFPVFQPVWAADWNILTILPDNTHCRRNRRMIL